MALGRIEVSYTADSLSMCHWTLLVIMHGVEVGNCCGISVSCKWKLHASPVWDKAPDR